MAPGVFDPWWLPRVSIADAGGGRLTQCGFQRAAAQPCVGESFSILPVFNPTNGVFHGNPLQHQYLACTASTDRLLATCQTTTHRPKTFGTAPGPAELRSRRMDPAANAGSLPKPWTNHPRPWRITPVCGATPRRNTADVGRPHESTHTKRCPLGDFWPHG